MIPDQVYRICLDSWCTHLMTSSSSCWVSVLGDITSSFVFWILALLCMDFMRFYSFKGWRSGFIYQFIRPNLEFHPNQLMRHIVLCPDPMNMQGIDLGRICRLCPGQQGRGPRLAISRKRISWDHACCLGLVDGFDHVQESWWSSWISRYDIWVKVLNTHLFFFSMWNLWFVDGHTCLDEIPSLLGVVPSNWHHPGIKVETFQRCTMRI